jgi:hypothetical protein
MDLHHLNDRGLERDGGINYGMWGKWWGRSETCITGISTGMFFALALLCRITGPDGHIVAKSWREIGSAFVQRMRRVVPLLTSAGLVTWLIWKITPQRLAQALASLNWPWLITATLVQLVVLFLWDAIALWWLFSQPHERLPFRIVLRARTDSALWSAISLEIGQGVFAWKLARALNHSVLSALGRCFLLAMFDSGTLLSLGLVGSFLTPNPIVHYLRWICVAGLCGYAGLVLTLRFMPSGWRRWLAEKEWAGWLRWWSWRDGLVLWAFRLGLFLLVFLYVWAGLFICGIRENARTIFGVIPFVLLAESLPGTGGLGERETTLYYLLGASPEQRAVLVSFGLIWSTVIILGRLVIGLISSWLPVRSEPLRQRDQEPSQVGATTH